MRIPHSVIEEIRNTADILEVVSDYVGMKRKGQNYFGLCPFHTEKTPSFSVNPQRQIFHCFGCGEGGNVITFLMKIENLSFVEAVRLLAERYRISIPEYREDSAAEKEKLALYDVTRFATDFFKENLFSEKGKEALAYLHNRGFSDEIVEKFELGYAPPGWDNLIKAALKFGFSMDLLKTVGLVIPNKSGGYYDRFRDRVMFPIHNLSGLIVGFGGRTLRNQPDTPKYINSPETPIYQKSAILYGLFQNRETIRKQQNAILVEGYADVISLVQHGFHTVVASSGTALTQQQARLVLRYAPNVTVLYDGDLAGANAALRGVDILMQEGLDVRVVALPEDTDPDSFVREKGAEALQEAVKKARDLIDFKIFAFQSEHSLETPQQKAELVTRLAESISKIRDEVVRSLYIQEVAKKLNLSETAVFRAVARQRRRIRSAPEETPATERVPLNARLKAERDLLEIALRFPRVVAIIYENLGVQELADEGHRMVLTQIYDQFVNTGEVKPENVLDVVEKAELQKFIVSVMVKEGEVESAVLRQWISDCVRTIKSGNVKAEAEQIRQEMKRAEEKKELRRAAELAQRYVKLRQKIDELKRKDFVPKDLLDL